MKLSTIFVSLFTFYTIPLAKSDRLGSQRHKPENNNLQQEAESNGAMENLASPKDPVRRELATLSYIYDNGRFFGGGTISGQKDSLPLGECQGDCDSDEDCDYGLKCYPREEGDDIPPGCDGQEPPGKRDADFCYDPNSPTYGNRNDGSFRLRLYWEWGFFWQESYSERFWCMECDKNDCSVWMDVQECGGSSARFKFLPQDHMQGQQIQILGTNLCLQVAVERNIDTYATFLNGCDQGNIYQRWISAGGSFDANKFDIRPYTHNTHCLTQPHHPKAGELIYAQKCVRAHRHDTAYWQKW